MKKKANRKKVIKTRTVITAPKAELHQKLKHAVALHQRGNFAEAKNIYQDIIAQDAQNFEALKLLGTIYAQQKEFDKAKKYLLQALQIDGNSADLHNNLGAMYKEQGHLQKAEEKFRKAVSIQPEYVDALGNLANILLLQGNLADSRIFFEKALSISPSHADVLSNFASLLKKEDEVDKAASILHNLLKKHPKHAIALNNMASIYHDRGEFSKAEELYRQAIHIRPHYAEALNNLANLLNDKKKFQEAEKFYRQAIAIRPDYAIALNNLANLIFLNTGQTEEAEQLYRKAIAINPEYSNALMNLANLLKGKGNLHESEKFYQRAAAKEKNNAAVRSNLVFAALYHEEKSAEEIFNLHTSQDFSIFRPIPPYKHTLKPEKYDPQRTLRIGYISGDFRCHSVGHFLLPVFSCNDQNRIHIYCYSTTHEEDSYTDFFRNNAKVWRTVAGLSAKKTAERIYQDNLDILIDLAGHTKDNQFPVLLTKPAPIQVCWIGYPSTTGLPEMDYLVGDKVVLPKDEPPAISEKPLRLPDCFLCFQVDANAPDVAELPAKSQEHITFGCFQGWYKVNEKSITLWSKILQAVPGSKLFIKNKSMQDESVRNSCISDFAACGIPAERLIIEGRSPLAEYLLAYEKADIVLDTFPFTGGTTTCQALWQGVPVLTLLRRRFAGRISASILTCIGLDDWIAETEEEYMQKAVDFARDTDKLAKIRAGLRERMQNSPLCDALAFTKNLENAYRRIWQEYCGKHAGSSKAKRSNDKGRPSIIKNHTIKRDRSESAYRKALALHPNDERAIYNITNFLEKQKCFTEAEETYRTACEQNPQYAWVFNNFGSFLQARGRKEEAAKLYRKAIEIDPDYAKGWNNLGNILLEQENIGEAQKCIQKAHDIDPQYVKPVLSLANIHYKTGELSRAEDLYKSALTMETDHAAVYVFLGHIYRFMGKLDQAIEAYKSAILSNPEYILAYASLLFIHLYKEDYTASKLLDLHTKDNFSFISNPSIKKEVFHTDFTAKRKIRLGYISGDFRKHSVGIFLLQALPLHDHKHFHVICYANNNKSDSLTKIFKKSAHTWHDITHMDDQDVVQLIRDDQIDILVDLSGYTGSYRFPVLLAKPAPVQVCWLGYPSTTGLPEIDYLIGDKVVLPESEPTTISEKPLRLPDCFLCFKADANAPDVAELPAKQNGHITFGCFQGWYKVNKKSIALWARIMKAVPGSKLFIKNKSMQDERVLASAIESFAKLNIAPDRLIIEGNSSNRHYLQSYGKVDIVLDTFPFTGGTTTCQALWQGVPVLTLLRRRFAGRMSASILTCIGLDDWIAETEEEYMQKAVDFARDADKLAKIRAGLRGRMQNSPLCDALAFTKNLENAYRSIWEKYCAEQAQPETGKTARPQIHITRQHGQNPAGKNPEPEDSIENILKKAVSLHQTGKLSEAKHLYKKILAINPHHFDAQKLLGTIYIQQNDLDKAIQFLESALCTRDDVEDIHNNIGQAYQQHGLLEKAEDAYRKALAIKPEYPQAMLNLIRLLRDLGRFSEMEQMIRKQLEKRPDSPAIINNLATTLKTQKKYDEAEKLLQQSLTLKPDFDLAHFNLANLYKEQNRIEKAEAFYLKTLKISPKYTGAMNNLANLLKDQGKFQEAEKMYRRCFETAHDLTAWANLCFTASYREDLTAYDIIQLAQESDLKEIRALNPPVQRTNQYLPQKKLRIGYLSADFRGHSVGRFIMPVLPRHNRSAFHITCYSLAEQKDRFTKIFAEWADVWRDVQAFTDRKIAECIARDNIDILVDLGGYTSKHFPVLLAKPAPIQVCWIGYPATTGLPEMDYLIGDKVVLPENEPATISEKPLRLPDCFLCFQPYENIMISREVKNRKIAPNDFSKSQMAKLPKMEILRINQHMPEVAELPARKQGYITFGCFQGWYKVNEKSITLWSRTLKAVPGSKFLIKNQFIQDKGVLKKCLADFAGHGIAADRLIIEGRSPFEEYLLAYERVDIVLDTFPFTGGTTTCQALWQGVPVLTLLRRRFAGRMSASILTCIGLNDWIAETEDEYVNRAVEFTHDINKLAEIRSGLRERMQKSPLCDAAKFTKNLEAAYRNIWEKYCAEQAEQAAVDQPLGEELKPKKPKIFIGKTAMNNKNYSHPQKSVLNVGGGSKKIAIPDHYNGWRHDLLDINPDAKPDILLDARKLTTLAPACYDAVYNSHNLEHFPAHEVPQILAGFFHILKPDGFAEIHVPDLQAVAEHWVKNNMDISDVLYHSPAGPIKIREVFYGHEAAMAGGNSFMAHSTGFSQKSLGQELIRAGFHIIKMQKGNFNLRAVAFRLEPSHNILRKLGLSR
ncbi:MAG: hypothetical protein CSB24_00090 [Deltaproteobacteria bacterium]|nr:MAG: hypothetical protein CSB24_00090 [Deltaproteobacteria bacterium]